MFLMRLVLVLELEQVSYAFIAGFLCVQWWFWTWSIFRKCDVRLRISFLNVFLPISHFFEACIQHVLRNTFFFFPHTILCLWGNALGESTKFN